jgi:hypothetical protein
VGVYFITKDLDVSLEKFKRDYLKNISRENINITHHGKVIRSKNFTDEEIKDIILEKHWIYVNKNEEGEFELKYKHPIKVKKWNVVIIVRPDNPAGKSIRIMTTYLE